MSEVTENPEQPHGASLFEELVWVHGVVRRDLDVVRRLADQCLHGRPADELVGEIHRLETNGPLWRLKVNCLRYCAFEAAARSLAEQEGNGSRHRLADGLTMLADDLLEHLDYEEESLESTLRGMPGL